MAAEEFDKLSQARLIDQACDQFELAWISGSPLSIEAVLEKNPSAVRSSLVGELISLEMELRRRRGEFPTASDYAGRFPNALVSLSSLQRSAAPDSVAKPSRSASDSPSSEAIEPGQNGSNENLVKYFGDYELLDVIARGGMGVVYKARQLSLNRVVALKMILSGEFATRESVERFNMEAKAAAMLDHPGHPGIVSIYEIGEHQGKHFYSMKYIEGTSLAELLKDGPMDPIRAAKIICDVADAVHYAHTRSIIHRDLKPSNILIDLDGRPRVTDFGLAKKLLEQEGLTYSGQVLGTPSYMPPEQAAGNISTIGPASDVYALGAVLYALATGRPPFQAATGLETMRQVIEREPVSPRQLNTSVPRDLETIILKCLEKSRPRRYGSASLLASELQRFIEGRPIQARPISRVSKVWRSCKRQPLIASLVLSIGITLIAATVVSSVYARREGAALVALKNEQAETRKQLNRAHVSEANAMRMSGRPGQRFGTLRAIKESLKISGPTRELADIATAALCLPDIEIGLEWDGHPQGTHCVALSPKMDQYAQVDFSGVISIRSLPGNQIKSTISFNGTFSDLGKVRYSDDGSFLFLSFHSPTRLEAWYLNEAKPRLVASQASRWAETLDGRHVIMAQGHSLLVIDALGVEPDKKIATNDDMTNAIFAGRFGSSQIVANIDGFSRVIDLNSGTVSQRYFADLELAAWPAVHPNGRWALWTSNENATGFLMDIETGRRLVPPYSGHRTEGIVPFVSRCGQVAFSNDWKGILRMWETRSSRPLLTIPLSDINNWLVVSSDNNFVGPHISNNKVRWMRFATGREFSQIETSFNAQDLQHPAGMHSLSPDGRILALSTTSGLALCDTWSGIPVAQVAARKHDEENLIGFMDDGSLLTAEERLVVHRKRVDGVDGTVSFENPSVVWNTHLPLGTNVGAAISKDGSVLGIPMAIHGAMMLRSPLKPDAENVEGYKRLTAHWDIRSMSASPNGKFLAGGLHSSDLQDPLLGTVIWDTSNEKIVLKLSNDPLRSVAFSARGGYLVSHSGVDSECSIYEFESWVRKASITSKYMGVFSPDESLFAIDEGAGRISLRRASDMQEFAKLSSPDEHIYAPICIAPDNSRLFARNDETGKLFVWNLAWIRRGLSELGLAQDWPAISLESSPDIAPPPLSVRVSPRSIPTFEAAPIQTWSYFGAGLDFSPDGAKLAIRRIGSLCITDTETGDEGMVVDGLSGPAGRVSWNHDGSLVMTSGMDWVRIYDAHTGAQKHVFTADGDYPFNSTFSPDGKRIAAGSANNKVYVWDVESGTRVREWDRHQSKVLGVEFMRDSNFLLSSSWDATVRIWDCQAGTLAKTFGPMQNEVHAIALNPKSEQLAALVNKEIVLVDTQTGQELRTLRGHVGLVRSVAFAPNGKWLATGSLDGVIKLWDSETGQELASFQAHTSAVHRIAISPHGDRLASSSWDGTTKLWLTSDGNLPRR
jgi:WD40 repeat protein/serine/threonine protein kinase